MAEELDVKLTPQARQVIDDLMRDARDEILTAAARSAVASNMELTEISVRDVLDAFDRLTRFRSERSEGRRRRLEFLNLYALLGVLLLTAGSAYAVARGSFFVPEPVPILLAFVGAVFAALGTLGSFLLSSSRRANPQEL